MSEIIQKPSPVKLTTQNAPFERLLTYLRTQKIMPYITGKRVLDFGCGSSFRTLKTLNGRCSTLFGFDTHFGNLKPFRPDANILIFGNTYDLVNYPGFTNGQKIEVITSLACFEHLEHSELMASLDFLDKCSEPGAIIIGTVPTPMSKPILEFLSYKLRLIDPSQIRDHKVYYNKRTLQQALISTRWQLNFYKRFQFGVNSFFIMNKKK